MLGRVAIAQKNTRPLLVALVRQEWSLRCNLRGPSHRKQSFNVNSISGLVVEYIVAIDVARVRYPADAQVKLARLVREVTEPRGGRVCDHCGHDRDTLGRREGDPKCPRCWGPRCPACGAALRRVACCGPTGDTQRSSAGLVVTI